MCVFVAGFGEHRSGGSAASAGRSHGFIVYGGAAFASAAPAGRLFTTQHPPQLQMPHAQRLRVTCGSAQPGEARHKPSDVSKNHSTTYPVLFTWIKRISVLYF